MTRYYRWFAGDVTRNVTTADGGQEVFCWQDNNRKMPKFCAVYGRTNWSNRENQKSYFRVPKVVTHKGEKFKKLTEKRRQTWLNRLRSGGAESVSARVCSDHFVKGKATVIKLLT